MPSQPPGQPPELWVPRADGSTEFAKEVKDLGLVVAELRGEVKQAVTWPKLTAVLATMFMATVVAAERFASSSAGRNEAAGAAFEKRITDSVSNLQDKQEAWQNKADAKLDAPIRVLVEGQRPSVAKKELEQRTGEKRDSEKWKRHREDSQ